MPTFVVVIDAIYPATGDRAASLLGPRFPEISIEQRYVSNSGEPHQEWWVCRAPNIEHIHRWLDAAGTEARSIERVGTGVRDREGS